MSTATDSQTSPAWLTFDDFVPSVCNGYAIVFFSQRRAVGATLLAITFLDPTGGVIGLAGLVIAWLAARALGFESARIRSGELLYNSLLACLGLAFLVRSTPVDWPLLTVLLPAVSLATLMLTVTLGSAMRQLFGLPALSLPFCVMTFLLFFVFHSFTDTPIVGSEPQWLLDEPTWLPTWIAMFLQSLGAAFFVPHVVAGSIVAILVASQSRLMLLLAAFGYASGMAFMLQTGLSAASFGHGWLGTNFIFCGIALGGMFFIASRASLVLAIVGAACCALIAVGMKSCFQSINAPPLSFPFVVTSLVTLYALRRRESFRTLFENPYLDATPEASFRRFHLLRQRYPAGHLPALTLPFVGTRVVTQGFFGRLTHQGLAGYALDFESLDAASQPLPADRQTLADTYTFGSPIVAPCAGTVVRVVRHVADNPLGEQNLRDNWGNLVTLVTDLGTYVTLCHFRQNDVCVSVGDSVVSGQLLGHCGNSGRSLLPHLHLQMQATPAPTSATVPFRIRNYITLDAAGRRHYQLSGIPPQGTWLEAVVHDVRLAACFTTIAAPRQRFRIERPGQPDDYETIELSPTTGREIVYRSVETGAVLRAAIEDDAVTLHGFVGPTSSLLAALWIGASVVPFASDRRLHWEDRVDPRPFRARWSAAAADVLDPLVGASWLLLRHRFEDRMGSDTIRILTEVVPEPGLLSAVTPQRVELRLRGDLGLAQILVTDDRGTTRITRESFDTTDVSQAVELAPLEQPDPTSPAHELATGTRA